MSNRIKREENLLIHLQRKSAPFEAEILLQPLKGADAIYRAKL